MKAAKSTLDLMKLYLSVTSLIAAVIFGSPELTLGPTFVVLSLLDKIHVGILFVINMSLAVGGILSIAMFAYSCVRPLKITERADAIIRFWAVVFMAYVAMQTIPDDPVGHVIQRMFL